MQVGFLITNGGTHSPEKWAAVTASQIIQIAADATSEQAIAGRKLELKLLDILETYHKKIQDEEKELLCNEGLERCNCEIDIFHHIDDPFNEIIDAAKNTQFEEHFKQQNVQDHLREVLRQHFTTVVNIERDWHKNQNQ